MTTEIAEVSTDVYTPFIESDPAASASEMRAAMDEFGYLFFRGLAPADDVYTVRRDVLELCRDAGWLDPSRDMMDAIAAPGHKPLMEGMPEYMPVYRQVLRTPSFHNFPCLPPLMDVAQKLLQGEVLVHPRRIGRITFPHYLGATTPPHQDHFYIRGTVETFSCWAPLGSCSMELGSLAVWPGSHKGGFIEHTVNHPGAVGGRGVPFDGAVWHTSDFGVGDVLFFHAFCIHKALPNLTEDRLRISTDNRYQINGAAIDPSALREHLT